MPHRVCIDSSILRTKDTQSKFGLDVALFPARANNANQKVHVRLNPFSNFHALQPISCLGACLSVAASGCAVETPNPGIGDNKGDSAPGNSGSVEIVGALSSATVTIPIEDVDCSQVGVLTIQLDDNSSAGVTIDAFDYYAGDIAAAKFRRQQQPRAMYGAVIAGQLDDVREPDWIEFGDWDGTRVSTAPILLIKPSGATTVTTEDAAACDDNQPIPSAPSTSSAPKGDQHLSIHLTLARGDSAHVHYRVQWLDAAPHNAIALDCEREAQQRRNRRTSRWSRACALAALAASADAQDNVLHCIRDDERIRPDWCQRWRSDIGAKAHDHRVTAAAIDTASALMCGAPLTFSEPTCADEDDDDDSYDWQ